MSGYTKHICEKETAEAQKQINQFIESLIPILPYKYDFNTINSLLKDYYPYEIFLISEKYKYYQIKEKSLSSKNVAYVIMWRESIAMTIYCYKINAEHSLL